MDLINAVFNVTSDSKNIIAEHLSTKQPILHRISESVCVLVLFPDPTLKEGKGLAYLKRFLGYISRLMPCG